ncbi:hypothetical protein PF004_g4009 [Phytophthora fragariae]|uniref:UBA domain-containing protein n=2 Tax=Phytophthora fragariae TaxID=53985 RepID=A0A6G0PK68_9STRA|nr:hypothetical protein PF004_g4009 [Phytophthora fragariae]
MVDADVYFGDDFGQKIDLTVRIREILRNYPEGTSIFKEMVQNADDAGATEVNLCLDYRQHASTGLAYEKLESFQGPSLLVHNNATFTDADFQSIQRIGDSLKKDNSKGWKTGRFGVGFNSVYHVTDLPTFVSGSQLVFFDPQACHLPNVNPSNPGKMIDYIAHSDLVDNFPNQIAPFRCFGCNFSDPFSGTIFRLALRTEDQARRSKLSNRAQTPAKMAEMLKEFADSLPTILLFLRNVCKISVLEWQVGEEAPTVLQEAMITNMTEEIEAKRSLHHSSLDSSGRVSTQRFSTDGIICDYPLKIEAREGATSRTREYAYLIMNQLGGGECTKIACDPANANQRLVPWGGVAVLTSTDTANSAMTGLAFCFLPLPTHTYLPVHVNGYFELSSNRRDIWFGDGLSGDGLLRAQWNIALLRDVIAPCYARAILHLADTQAMEPEHHVQLLPQALPPAPWDSLTYAFFSLIRSKPCLYSEVGGGRWVSPTESMVVRSFSSSNQLEQLLLDDGFPVVNNLAEDLERVLVKTGTIPSYVEPHRVREAYKTKNSCHAGDCKAVECLLSFILSDMEPDRLNALIGVNFLPVADGTLRTFERRSEFDPSELEYLCAMGFSRQYAVYALAVAGNNEVETALNWLLQNPNPSIVNEEGANTPFFIPTREELELLEKARGHLVNIEAISTSGLVLLSSETAEKYLNVQKLDYQGFEDMLAVVLPEAWFGKLTVPWNETIQEGAPNAEWFRQLWTYIGKSDHLAAFKDKWPIVPTSSHTLTQLSVSAGVLSAELIPDGCLRCLQKLQVRLLLPNIFASFQPNPDVWQYIHQPTAAGVLSCIGIILATGGLVVRTLVDKIFEHTDKFDRDCLLKFLISVSNEDIGATHKQICCNLPIFPGFRAIRSVEGRGVQWMDDGDANASIEQDFSPSFVSLTEIEEKHQEPLLCVGVTPKFLDDNFVFVKESDSVFVDFLLRMGVRQISKVEFFAKYLIPRFDHVDPKVRVRFVCQLLAELTALLGQDTDGTLSSIMETAAIFPTMTGDLKSIDDLYDPEIDEFMEIMDGSFFPALELQDPQPLSALRSLGLQRTLSRRSILSLAVSLESSQLEITADSDGVKEEIALDEVCDKLRSRSIKFFQYVDTHMEQLVIPTFQRNPQSHAKKAKKSNKGIRFLRNFLGDDRSRSLDTHDSVPTPEDLEEQAMEQAEINDFKAKLAIIMWIPVCEDKPHPAAPWIKQGQRIIVASPQQSRPAKHLWLCSSQFHIIKCSVHSAVLRGVLGWDKHLPVETVASQLKEISRMFDDRQKQAGGDLRSERDGDMHVVWTAVYSIYQVLSRFFETESVDRRNQVLAILSGNGKYVWVGDRFVSSNQVAAVAVVNAEPYLYTIPNELLHFRPFLRAIGVRERFALPDYVHVLGAMYKESLANASTDEDCLKATSLSDDKLTTVIGLIQLISDTLQHHSDYELFAPDRNGVLEFAANLTYDDAPWLDQRDYETSSASTRFIHPKISNEVAAKMGSRSLRSQLLSESSHEAMSFGGEGDVEAFGQTEALTKRIAHILEQYPEGPNIISELIQNADDAGATRVRILYSSCSYGTSSLLTPAMAKWQGPSLYCYNDAEFSDGDFINLARVGQASKLQRAATTGRFGLGFNSVYHFTDLPSIVSAKSIVIFDPHATHLPGISAANPGIKIRFANANIVKQFPDQFAPFKNVFGCDLEHHYNGTLFRFPLRSSVLAEASEIKRRGYSHNEIVDLFKSFQTSIIDTMLFLRNVRKVEVYLQSQIDQAPVLLYDAEVPEEDRGEAWRKIDRFMRNGELAGSVPRTTELSAKREFYARLRSTPAEELPSVTQVLHIRRQQQKQLNEMYSHFGGGAGTQGLVETEGDRMEATTETYLVCNQIGGGKAREIACAAENESLKLIPWVGVAGRIDGVPTEGRAFCFLPLPVRVGLPVHINGYFELSSNRRDIWHGDDMTGDGKLRSEWNASLLADAVAPAYLTFLLEAKEILVLPHSETAPVAPELLRQLQQTLAKVGVYIVDTTYVTGEKTVQWLLAHKYAFKLSSNGVLAALSRYQFRHERQSFDEIFAAATAAERLVLCDFFSHNSFDAVANDYQPILFELPIFPVSASPVLKATGAQNTAGVHFVSLRRGGYVPGEDADPRILDESFFRVEKDETRRFLRDCGLEEWSYTKILLDHVFPQLATLEARDSALVDSVLVSALETLPFHQRNDSRFREVIRTYPVIPSRKRVFRAVNQLHDPSVSALSELVGENSLPAPAFSTPSTVEILRSLGLRTGLSCHAVLESARSIEAMSEENDDTSVDQALQKAQSLLTIVNKHFDVMMSGSTSSDNPEQEGDSESVRAIQDIVADLTEVQWLPVRLEAPDPAMPWKNLAESGSRRFSSASKMRPLKDAWFCSSSMDILDGELTSEELIAAFGWKEQIDSFVIAKQLEAIGIRWEDHRRKKDAGEPMASKTPTWRFPLSEIHLMYEEVESHRLSDEEGWTMSPVHRKLANALWIWTGNRFAYPCQIAVEADASLEPLLYSCPSEHIIPRSLIASFGLKEKFTTVDYLEAIMRLPRSTILEEMQIAACLKIYEIVGGDTSSLETGMNSFVSQEMVLLDHSARLIPAVQLTFDDMEWNESREVRRGATFVSKGVPKDVARLLGAASLHSKLAQTSVTSRRVVCPPAVALQNVLPPRSEWYRAFLWETILAAERFGGTQVDFFLDTRHHSSQRVIQPSLQPLQDEALCIHIHDMVLSEDDINNLFHGETSRAGLLCGFVVSDCMQILSGDGFYILDPTGCYLSSSAGGVTIQAPSSGRAQSIGRRYEVLGQDFVRYPDQLLPFTTLPACQSNISRGTGSTLIRFPWRKTGSVVSSYVLDARKADKLVSFLKSQLFQTLIFTESVHRISVWSVGKESEYASHCHGEVSLDSPDGTLRKRNMTRQNQEWKKKFSLQSFFKSPVIPENQMEIVVNLELENRQYQDTWLFADNIGLGRSRDLACTAVHEMLHSTPYVSVACHIFRDGSPAPRLRGHIYKIVDTHQQVGLPVHINGCFKKSIKDKQLTLTASSNQISSEAIASGASGSEQQVAAGWNRILLEDGASDAYVKLLLVAKRRYERSFPKSLYNIWPTLQKREDGKELGALVQAHTFHTIDMRELFLCTDGIFRALGSGYQLDIGGMNIQVSSFAQLHFPAFDVPSRILQDCSRLLPSRMYAVTPKVMRRFLRSVSSSEVHSDICLSLLEYCLSDLSFPLPSDMDPVWTEFHGLSLLPLEDGSIGVLRVNQRRTSYVLASFNQIELLRPLGHLFVSLAASRRLAKYFSDSRFTTIFGLVSFSIKTLSDNIERVLPSSWKNQAMIEWDPSSPVEIDELWLYRFWQVVHFERRSLGYFSSWPLIPVKGSRLVSCGKMDKAICVWDGSADSEISAQVAELFQASAMQQEKKMADFDAERKRLMELSSAKFQTEEELAEDTYSDEEVDGDEEVEEVDEEEGDEEDVEGEGENESDGLSGGETEEAVQLGDIPSSALENEEYPRILESFSNDGDDVAEVLSPTSISLDLDNVSDADGAETAEIGEGFALPVYPVEDEPHEFCSRETLHNVLTDLNISMVELAYLGGQESDIVPRSADLGLTVLDGIFASDWEHLRWGELGETKAVLIAEFFSHNGDTYGGYNRVQMERLKQLPIFVNIGNVPCAIHGGQDFFLIPPGLNLTDMPLPPDARQRFLKSNPGLNAFYRELGVEEMSDRKLLMYVLPVYSDMVELQRDHILLILLQKWQSLRGSAELTALLRTSPLFRTEEGEGASYLPAGAYCDPRNSVLAAIYDGVPGKFPAQRYRTIEWLDFMAEIGLQTEVTVEIFVECAQRIDEQCSGKQALTPEDDHLITALHQYFVQNFDKFDRSRSFFERIAPLAFVPATVYEAENCATPEDQALVYSTMPILANAALPPRVLYSRLGIQSPPPQDQVVAHLLSITNGDRPVSSRSLDWQFFLPMVEVFQAIFKFLQEHWSDLGVETKQRLTTAAVIPVGSTLVKGSRLFFHLGENLSPLMFEVPRAFGAYDALFRHMGSKEAPEVNDYIRLLRDLNEECCGHPLNLNELIASARAIDLLATAISESSRRLSLEEKNAIFLPSNTAVMQSMLLMAYNDSAALCSSIDLTELHVVHPRISTRCCKILGVPGITSVVTEELDGEDNPTELLARDDIAHFNSVLASQQFADGLRKIITAQQQKASSYDAFGFIPDFEDLNHRIVNLATYEVNCVAELQSRFIAKLDFPARRIDVTKTARQESLSFLDQTRRRIYIAKCTLEARSEMGMRASHLVARCINQLLGGVLQDCSVLESILTCDEVEIPRVLQLLDIYEDPVLIVENLRGVLGQPLSEVDCANVELAPLRSCLPGELVAVEDESGTLCYGKILREQASNVAGVSQFEVKVASSSTRLLLATQLYFFRSARVGTSSGSSNTTTSERPAEDLVTHSDNIAMPASVVALASESQDGAIVSGFSHVKAPPSAVSSSNVLSAVNDLLSRLNVTLDTSVEELMAENLRLQRRLEVAEASRRAAATQIDAAIREKKEVQDSLVCAVCLENKVNRVLIPCGHIYCASCVGQLPRPSCPICRQNIVSSSVFHVPS